MKAFSISIKKTIPNQAEPLFYPARIVLFEKKKNGFTKSKGGSLGCYSVESVYLREKQKSDSSVAG